VPSIQKDQCIDSARPAPRPAGVLTLFVRPNSLPANWSTALPPLRIVPSIQKDPCIDSARPAPRPAGELTSKPSQAGDGAFCWLRGVISTKTLTIVDNRQPQNKISPNHTARGLSEVPSILALLAII